MRTSFDDEAARIYVNLMCEVRDRLNAVERSRMKEFADPMFGHEYMAAEFAMLQLRMVCELIAFGCLVVHGDVRETRTAKFHREFAAKRIFEKLEKYHPDFFPKAVIRVTLSSGRMDMQERPDGHLTRDELEKLYTYCLEHLHRGRAEQILANEQRLYDYSYIGNSAHRLGWLLDQHVITLASGDLMFVDMDRNGKVAQDWMPLIRG